MLLTFEWLLRLIQQSTRDKTSSYLELAPISRFQYPMECCSWELITCGGIVLAVLSAGLLLLDLYKSCEVQFYTCTWLPFWLVFVQDLSVDCMTIVISSFRPMISRAKINQSNNVELDYQPVLGFWLMNLSTWYHWPKNNSHAFHDIGTAVPIFLRIYLPTWANHLSRKSSLYTRNKS